MFISLPLWHKGKTRHMFTDGGTVIWGVVYYDDTAFRGHTLFQEDLYFCPGSHNILSIPPDRVHKLCIRIAHNMVSWSSQVTNTVIDASYLFETKFSRRDHVKFIKGSLQKILLGPFLNTLSHLQRHKNFDFDSFVSEIREEFKNGQQKKI